MRKRLEGDRQEQTPPIDRKRLRLDESTASRQIIQSQLPISISPVESPFRILGDQHVPATEPKKDPTILRVNLPYNFIYIFNDWLSSI